MIKVGTRLAHKSSLKFFSRARRELEIFYVSGGKGAEAYYREPETRSEGLRKHGLESVNIYLLLWLLLYSCKSNLPLAANS